MEKRQDECKMESAPGHAGGEAALGEGEGGGACGRGLEMGGMGEEEAVNWGGWWA